MVLHVGFRSWCFYYLSFGKKGRRILEKVDRDGKCFVSYFGTERCHNILSRSSKVKYKSTFYKTSSSASASSSSSSSASSASASASASSSSLSSSASASASASSSSSSSSSSSFLKLVKIVWVEEPAILSNNSCQLATIFVIFSELRTRNL